MPEAAAKALLVAAEKAAVPTGGAQGAGPQASAQRHGSSPGPATQAQEGTERPQAAAEPPAHPPAEPRATRHPPGARAADARPRRTRTGRGCGRPRAARGVSDADLANLIRNAVGQGPIPADRARAALPEMLARINEEITEQTIALVDMFYPPAEPAVEQSPSEARRGDERRLRGARTAAGGMSGKQRRRLATAAADAGYPGALLPAIAQATLPGYAAGQGLSERQLGQVADAVECLAEAGLSAEQIGPLIGGCRERAPETVA